LVFGDGPLLARSPQTGEHFVAAVWFAPAVFFDDEKARRFDAFVSRESMPAREALAAPADGAFVVATIDDARLADSANRAEHGSARRRARRAALWFAYEEAPILKSLVEQSGQEPCTAGRPFFIVTCVGFWISFFALHFTQYASGIETLLCTCLAPVLEGPPHPVAKASA
jgi:hypothetical protein